MFLFPISFLKLSIVICLLWFFLCPMASTQTLMGSSSSLICLWYLLVFLWCPCLFFYISHGSPHWDSTILSFFYFFPESPTWSKNKTVLGEIRSWSTQTHWIKTLVIGPYSIWHLGVLNPKTDLVLLVSCSFSNRLGSAVLHWLSWTFYMCLLALCRSCRFWL